MEKIRKAGLRILLFSCCWVEYDDTKAWSYERNWTSGSWKFSGSKVPTYRHLKATKETTGILHRNESVLKLFLLIQIEMTCLYKGGKGSSCPKTVYRAKTAFQNAAIRHGERLTQYYNTPSCDKKTQFWNRYVNIISTPYIFFLQW